MAIETIIEKLKRGKSYYADKELIEDLESDIDEKDREIRELETKLSKSISCVDAKFYSTALGDIVIINETGNLDLEQELNDFFELLIQKYGN